MIDVFALHLDLLLLSGLIVFVAAVVQGATGFGFGLVAVPILTMYLSPTIAIPVLMVAGFVLSLVLFLRVYHYVRPKQILTLMTAGAVGIPVGVGVMISTDPDMLRVIIGIVVGLTALIMLGGFQRASKNETMVAIPVGLTSGILMGSTGLAGAPVILFFTNQGINPSRFRANITAYLLVMGGVTVPVLFISGALTQRASALSLILLPFCLAGLATGIWLSPRISAVVFRRIALSVVLIAAVVATVVGLVGNLHH